jgi:hypothetical protein
MIEVLNQSFKLQEQAIMGLHKLVTKNLAEEGKDRKKILKDELDLEFINIDLLTSKRTAQRNARKDAENAFIKSILDEELASMNLTEEEEKKYRAREAQRIKEQFSKELGYIGETAALEQKLAEAQAQRDHDNIHAINILRQKQIADQAKLELSIEEGYQAAKEKLLDRALKAEAKKRGVLVSELNEEELANAERVAEAQLGSFEDYTKRKKKAAKEEEQKGPRVINGDPEHKGASFVNAFTGTAGAVKDAVKDKMKTLVSRDEETGNVNISGLVNGLADFAQSLDNKIRESAGHQSKIDTRLYGSTSNSDFGGSYWRVLSGDIMSIAGASPLILQTEMIASLEKLVDSGISHNLKLRAFLDTVTDKIASTFEVNDNTMLRLIRLQQQDSTAARMGMESALNGFLNNMFETTEYLTKVADTVRGNLEEAQALMGAKQATEFEYQVQKWLGSFYSVGMSDQAVTNISTTLGQLAAGQIEALTGSGTGNLMIMAANSAGLSIADILKDGLDAETTNKLLQATVNYLAQIAKQSDSKVVQQQLAGVFGLKASDIQSITNLVSDNNKTLNNIATTNLTNEGMMLELAVRAATMTSRVDMGTMMNNLWENVQYSMASGIANNPAMYGLYKMAGLLQNTVGGIPISFANIYGFGIDLNTSVAQLMQVGALAGGIIGSLPQMLGGLANMVGGGATMLATAGIATQGKHISRGDGAVGANALAKSGAGTSSSGLVGNASSSDIQGAEMAGGQDSIDSQGAQGKEENEDATRDDIIEILKMLFGILGKKIDENTEAVKGTGGIFNSNENMGGFTNASTTKNSSW